MQKIKQISWEHCPPTNTQGATITVFANKTAIASVSGEDSMYLSRRSHYQICWDRIRDACQSALNGPFEIPNVPNQDGSVGSRSVVYYPISSGGWTTQRPLPPVRISEGELDKYITRENGTTEFVMEERIGDEILKVMRLTDMEALRLKVYLDQWFGGTEVIGVNWGKESFKTKLKQVRI